MTMCFFSQKAATLKTPENQTNYKQLQNTKTIESTESQNKNTPGCFCNKEKESQKDKQEANKNMAIARSLDNNPQKTITADDHKNDKPKGEKNEKSIFVIGDSMVKHLNGWEMSKKLNANCKVFVKTFSGAKTTCMNDYVKPSVRSTPDHFILHVGTNDLSSDKSSEEIARSTTDLATSVKNKKHDVSISNIIIRADNKKLEEKRCEVNSFLGKLCKEKNHYLIDHFTRIKRNHLNKGKLHLNKKGTKLLSDIFVKELSKVFKSRNIDNLSKQFDVCDSDEPLGAESATDCKRFLKSLRTSNLDKLVFAHLNVNFIRNMFEMLSDQIKGNIDVLLVSETKIDDSFPNGNFLIDGFSTPYRLDQNSNGGGLMLLVREDIPSNLVEAKPIEGFYIELNLRNDKWLLNCSYNPHKNNIGNHLKALSNFLDSHSSAYEKVLILGDFNIEVDDQNMKTFCEVIV